MPTGTDSEVGLQVRMPAELRQAMDLWALRHRRTRNDEILTALDIYLLIVEETPVAPFETGYRGFYEEALEMVSVHLRMSDDMRSRLSVIAERHGRTRTAEIAVALYVYLAVVYQVDQCIFDRIIQMAVTPEVRDLVREAFKESI